MLVNLVTAALSFTPGPSIRAPVAANSQLIASVAEKELVDATNVPQQSVAKLYYFPVWAKGPAPALALAHSGMPWEGEFPEDWKALKASTPWGHLPVLETELGMIGHEIAILNWVAQKAGAKMAGQTDLECAISQQLLHEAEDIYSKVYKFQPDVKRKDKATTEELDALWAATDSTAHNKQQGLQVHLAKL